MLFKLTESNKMRRLFVFGAIFLGLMVAFGLAGGGGLQTVQRAEATQTDWFYPTSGGITAGSGPSQGSALASAPCTNCYITSIVPDLVYQNDPDHADGTTANFNNNNSLDGAWMHHMVILNACMLSSRIFASGNERTVWTAPAGYGYYQPALCPNSAPAQWAVNWHIHNNSTNTRHVALKLTVTWTTTPQTPLTPFWWDMGSIQYASEYQVDEGYTDSHTGPGQSGDPYHISDDSTSTVQGKIVSIGGHVHDYGISVSAYNNRLGDYVCTSVAGYGTGSRYLQSGGPGTPGHPAGANAVTLNQSYHEPTSPPDDRYHIQQMTTCSPTPTQAIICVGDVIRLHTQYNNTSLFPILDAMGIIAGDIDTTVVMPDMDHDGTWDVCDSDMDGDSVANGSDDCPMWPNASQAYPLVGIHPTTGDADCDGFPDSVAVPGRATETYIGTNPIVMCAATGAANDEGGLDANPMDFNDNQIFNGQDSGQFGGAGGGFGKNVADGPFYGRPGARYNLNGDTGGTGGLGIINGQDTGKYGGASGYFNKVCVP